MNGFNDLVLMISQYMFGTPVGEPSRSARGPIPAEISLRPLEAGYVLNRNHYLVTIMKQLLPNILNIELGKRLGLDAFYLKFGITKVVRDGSPSFTKGSNGSLNRYLERQMKRLDRLAKVSPKRYWKLALHLLRSSKALRLVALRNVRPHWYKGVPALKVREWMEELNGICYRPRETFEINRTAIPKDDGTKRYINDPGVPWRMYLWM